MTTPIHIIPSKARASDTILDVFCVLYTVVYTNYSATPMRDAVNSTLISLFPRENLLDLLTIKTKCKSYTYSVKEKSLYLTYV